MIGYTLRSWIAAILWMAIILVLSSLPGWFFEPIQRGIGDNGISLVFSDPVAHFGEYVVLGVLLYNALRGTCPRRSLDWLLFMVLLIGMGFAFLDEAHQFLVGNGRAHHLLCPDPYPFKNRSLGAWLPSSDLEC